MFKKFEVDSKTIGSLSALYIHNTYEVRALYNATDDLLHRFNDSANVLPYIKKLASYTNLMKVSDGLYIDKSAVNGVIVERNDDNYFVVKILIGTNKITVTCEFDANDAFDCADNLKKMLNV